MFGEVLGPSAVVMNEGSKTKVLLEGEMKKLLLR